MRNDPNNWRVLFGSVGCRDKVLPSRILLAPINTGLARNGRPTAQLLRFHERRSSPRIGISMLGNVATATQWISNSGTAVLSSCKDIGRFAVIARAISGRGSLAGIQLGHSPVGLSPSRKWRAADPRAEVTRLRSIVESMPERAIQQHLEQFVSSARLAEGARFDVVQIHAAHGYLLSLLTMALTNHRTDKFAEQGAWLESFVQDLRSVLRDSLLSVRLSVFSGVLPPEQELATARALALRLATAGVDIVDLSAGLYTIDRQLVYPNRGNGLPPYYAAASSVAERVPCLVSFAGNITDLRVVPTVVPGNLLVAVGRAFIADSQFAEKMYQERFDEISWCERTGHCHFFSRGKSHIECGVNPNLD